MGSEMIVLWSALQKVLDLEVPHFALGLVFEQLRGRTTAKISFGRVYPASTDELVGIT